MSSLSAGCGNAAASVRNGWRRPKRRGSDRVPKTFMEWVNDEFTIRHQRGCLRIRSDPSRDGTGGQGSIHFAMSIEFVSPPD